jgi:hypothetical protein
MNTQETIENDKLATMFQETLIQELQRRKVKFTSVTVVNFADVNIDIHIYIENYWLRDIFRYIGIGWLKHRKLSEMTLEAYIKDFVNRELESLKANNESVIEKCTKILKDKSHWSLDYIRSTEEQLQSAHSIASWLNLDTF